MAMEDEEVERRANRFLTEERRRQLEREAEEDFEVRMEENPPLPEEMPEEAPQKKVRAVVEEEEVLPGRETVEEEVVVAPMAQPEAEPAKPKQLAKNELFEGYEKLYEEKKEDGAGELDLPALNAIEVDEEEVRRHEAKVR